MESQQGTVLIWVIVFGVDLENRIAALIVIPRHRKPSSAMAWFVVVDGRVGWMGSQNLIDRRCNSSKNLKRGLQWQELMARTTGPVVSGINVIFLSDWYSETDEILGAEHVAAADVVFDEAMMYAITSSCQRRLDVWLFVSEEGDQGPDFHAQRSYHRALLRAVEAGYRKAGRELTLAEWEKEPLRATALDGLARLASALQ